jgi:hypothetical protein
MANLSQGPARRRKDEAIAGRRQGSRAASADLRTPREPTIPVMLRPAFSQKVCVERIAEQLGRKRSQLDPTFYLTGALLAGVERLGKEEMIGTWTRKQVAIFLKSAFTPLFELLYEENELPLVFALLLSRQPAASAAPEIAPSPGAASTPASIPLPLPLTPAADRPAPTKASDPTQPPHSANPPVGLDGFPAEI